MEVEDDFPEQATSNSSRERLTLSCPQLCLVTAYIQALMTRTPLQKCVLSPGILQHALH